jgi:hypothetical protein
VFTLVDLLWTFQSQPGPQAEGGPKIKMKNGCTDADSLENHIPKYVGGGHHQLARNIFLIFFKSTVTATNILQ